MKKIVTVLLAVLVLCTTAVSAFAVPSIQPEKAPKIIDVTAPGGEKLEDIVTEEGEVIEAQKMVIKVTPLAEKDTLPEEEQEGMNVVLEKINESYDTEELLEKIDMKAVVETKFSANTAVVDTLFNLSMNDVAVKYLEEGGLVEIQFEMPEIQEGDTVVMMRLLVENDVWEELACEVHNGYISVLLTYSSAYSPVLILSENKRMVISPDTGDIEPETVSETVPAVAAVCTLLAVSVAFVLIRKKYA